MKLLLATVALSVCSITACKRFDSAEGKAKAKQLTQGQGWYVCYSTADPVPGSGSSNDCGDCLADIVINFTTDPSQVSRGICGSTKVQLCIDKSNPYFVRFAQLKNGDAVTFSYLDDPIQKECGSGAYAIVEKISNQAPRTAPSSTPTSQPTPVATPEGPSDDFIKSAVTAIVKRGVTNTAMYWRTDNVSVQNIAIVRRGEFHQNERFFLVQVRTSGAKHETWRGELACNNQNIACERRCTFEGTNEYRVYRNDYGDWQVEIAEPWNFRLNRNCDRDSMFG